MDLFVLRYHYFRMAVTQKLTARQRQRSNQNFLTFIQSINMLPPITISPNIQSGLPVFSNTRVPVKNLFDYLKAGHSLDVFLDDFPSVKKEQAIQVLEHFENFLNFHSPAYAQSTA